jgi:type IV secretion system protein VirB11
MPRQPESEDGIGAPLPPVGAGILPGAIGPAVSGHFADPAADAAFVDADGGLWLRRYGEDAVMTGIMFTPAEVGLMVDAITAGPGRLPGRYTEGFVVATDADIEIFAARPPAVVRPGIAVHRRTPALLDRHVAAGQLTAAEADNLRGLLVDNGTVLAAAPSLLGRRRLAATLTAEAWALGLRTADVYYAGEHLEARVPGVALSVLPGGPMNAGVFRDATALARVHRLVFPAWAMVAQPWLLDHAEGRRPGCLMTVHAQSPRHALDRLSRLLDRTRRPAPGATELVDAVVFARVPGAVWKVLDPVA